MTGPILVLLLVTAQGPPKPETRRTREAGGDRRSGRRSRASPDLRPRRPAADGPAGEAQDRNRDENPFENERPKCNSPRASGGASRQRFFTLERANLAPAEEGTEFSTRRSPPAPLNPSSTSRMKSWGPENFDRWIFGEGLGEERRRQALEDRLVGRIEAEARRYDLTIPQRDKLRLAGMGDIKRFFDRVEERRRISSWSGETWPPGDASARPAPAALRGIRGRPVRRRFALREDAPQDGERCRTGRESKIASAKG